MKSPVDHTRPTGLILEGYGVRAPIWLQIHYLHYPRENLSKPTASVRAIIPRFSTTVKQSGPIRELFLAPSRFGGRTRLAVNQGHLKNSTRFCSRMGSNAAVTEQPVRDQERGAEYLCTDQGKGCRYVQIKITGELF